MKKPAYSLEGLLQKSFKKTTATLSGRAVVQYLLSKPTKYFIKDIHLRILVTKSSYNKQKAIYPRRHHFCLLLSFSKYNNKNSEYNKKA